MCYIKYISTYNLRTHSIVKGLLKKRNEIAMLTAFLAVVTVAAIGAPLLRTRAKTKCIPRYPERLNKNP